eukprot:TRINITY_DN2794_c0_g1_i6.p1 TRINITY_DN2794_c0_g1~~TRINITY_DN2794_c0_g1_i6.p1  ORF type:complete len:218 (+),score=72.26 TRINITY_DN2794_c0_g1_i6:76-729(+)
MTDIDFDFESSAPVTQNEAEEAYIASQPPAQPSNTAGGNNDFDDLFGGAPTTNSNNAGAPVDGVSPIPSPGVQGFIPTQATAPKDLPVIIDPEEEERQEKLRRVEEQRLAQLQEKLKQELDKKEERISNGRAYLAEWHQERETMIEKRRAFNRQTQQTMLEGKKNNNVYKNSWDKIVGNVGIKESEYPGTKDVTRMRQALLNKKNDTFNTVQTYSRL